MLRRALPAGLAFVALIADLQGAHAVSLGLLLVSIPAAFVLVLDCYGDLIAARCTGVRPALAAGGLGLLVLSAALRSPAVVGGVPQVAVSAVVLALLLYGATLLTVSGRRTSAAAGTVEADESYAEAA